MDLEIVKRMGKCPACGHRIEEGHELTPFSSCEKCGLVFAKCNLNPVNENSQKRNVVTRAKPDVRSKKQPPSSRDKRIAEYMAAHGKSAIAGFLLAVLVGPLAIFYVSTGGGLMVVLLLIVLFMASPSGAFLFGIAFWVLSILMVPIGVAGYNEKKRAEANLLAGEE